MGENSEPGLFSGIRGRDFWINPSETVYLKMGWSHACPVVDDVAKKYGPEWTLKRYAECNFVFGLVVEAARDLNTPLYLLLTTPTPRLKNEPPGRGHFNPKLVPESFYTEMSPLSTPWGYAIPRVIIEEMGRGENNSERTQERDLRALNLIDKAVKSSKTPIDLLVKLSEAVSKLDADPKEVLSHTLSADMLQEEGCESIFDRIKQKIDKSAPTLLAAYNAMSVKERISKGIINF